MVSAGGGCGPNVRAPVVWCLQAAVLQAEVASLKRQLKQASPPLAHHPWLLPAFQNDATHRGFELWCVAQHPNVLVSVVWGVVCSPVPYCACIWGLRCGVHTTALMRPRLRFEMWCVQTSRWVTD